ncbi:hypothetical protein RF11_12151 [Thelohanellus kitauei]|uniref:Integrase catalytic domain-containing protein n=1 Tax=Thelohanellus kitauei TaxID=669202 RepID=A0A0C2MMS5_THEKT|nr:hypothetical protein RF11_12151 [Thelohanellus kitauei]
MVLNYQGANFGSDLMKEVCESLGIKKLELPLTIHKNEQWPIALPSLCYAYNTSRNDATKIYPFELVFRRAGDRVDSCFDHFDHGMKAIFENIFNDLYYMKQTNIEYIFFNIPLGDCRYLEITNQTWIEQKIKSHHPAFSRKTKNIAKSIIPFYIITEEMIKKEFGSKHSYTQKVCKEIRNSGKI